MEFRVLEPVNKMERLIKKKHGEGGGGGLFSVRVENP